MKKRNRDILVCLVIVSVLLLIAVIVALIVVESSIESKASNDAWLAFIGSISGGFIAAFASFSILYLNRKDMMEIKNLDRSDTSEDKRQQEIDRIRDAVKEVFEVASVNEIGKEMVVPMINAIKTIPCVISHGDNEFNKALNGFKEEIDSGYKGIDYLKHQEKILSALNDFECSYVKRND